MIRLGLGAAAGFVVFVLSVALATLIVGMAWPEMAAVEDPLDYTNPMRFLRLGVGAAGVLLGGFATGLISRRGRLGGLVLGVVFLIAFIPVHISLWTSFPLWYHASFLLYLVPLAVLGAALARGAAPQSATAPPP